MTETYTTRVQSWLSKPKGYPNVGSCIGTEVGNFHRRFWWHAVGEAQELFQTVEQDMVNQLNTVTDAYHSSIHYYLYMIGKSPLSAFPTIMFFCNEKEPRKRAKEIVDRSILRRLPGFRVGHQAHQPTIGPLIQPASRADTTFHSGFHSSHSVAGTHYRPMNSAAGNQQLIAKMSALNVYVDLSSVSPVGMAIYVELGTGVLRRATANTVWDGSKAVAITVSHIFFEENTGDFPPEEDSDSDCDFGSDTTSENDYRDDVEPMRSTSSTETKNILSSLGPTISMVPINPMLDIVSEGRSMHAVETANTSSFSKRGYSDGLNAPTIPSADQLSPLGSLIRSSIDQDWAVIEIENPTVLKVLLKTRSMAPRTHRIPNEGDTAIAAHTSRGSIKGVIAGQSTYIKLPSSTTYEKVHVIRLDEPLAWGDCGTWFTNSQNDNVYGHLVASSMTRDIAYIMAADHVFPASGVKFDSAAAATQYSNSMESADGRSSTALKIASSDTEHRDTLIYAGNWMWSPEYNDHYIGGYDASGNVHYKWASAAQSSSNVDYRPHTTSHARFDSGRDKTDSLYDPDVTVDHVQEKPMVGASGSQARPATPVSEKVRQKLPNFIAGTPHEGWYEHLDTSYRMRSDREAHAFFRVGRVFSLLYAEPARVETRDTLDDEAFTRIAHGDSAYTQIRRFVVVSVSSGFVYACAISTYRGQGTLKRGCDPTEHALVYNQGVSPDSCYLAGEIGLGLKAPIEVIAADTFSELTKESRIRFGKIYSIEWNIKVKDLGMVADHHLGRLVEHYQSEEYPYGTAF